MSQLYVALNSWVGCIKCYQIHESYENVGVTEILRSIWLFSANTIKSSESFIKHPTQLIIAADNCHIYYFLWNCILKIKSDTYEIFIFTSIAVRITEICRESADAQKYKSFQPIVPHIYSSSYPFFCHCIFQTEYCFRTTALATC